MFQNYEFTDDSYTAMGAAGVAWQEAIFVLRQGRPLVRRHIGPVLTIAGRDRQERWLVVALTESNPLQDEQYTVAGARYLDAAEVAAILRMLKGQL